MSDRSVWIAPNLMQPCSLCQKWGLIPVLTCQPASRHIRWRFLQLGILSGSKEEIKITPAFDSFKHRINLKVRKAMAVLEEVLNTTFCNLYLWWKNTSLRMHVIYVKVHDCLLVEPEWQTLKYHPCSPLSHSFLVGKIWMVESLPEVNWPIHNHQWDQGLLSPWPQHPDTEHGILSHSFLMEPLGVWQEPLL